eukprot:3449034-Pleurochrysis_carterae.AAC.7
MSLKCDISCALVEAFEASQRMWQPPATSAHAHESVGAAPAAALVAYAQQAGSTATVGATAGVSAMGPSAARTSASSTESCSSVPFVGCSLIGGLSAHASLLPRAPAACTSSVGDGGRVGTDVSDSIQCSGGLPFACSVPTQQGFNHARAETGREAVPDWRGAASACTHETLCVAAFDAGACSDLRDLSSAVGSGANAECRFDHELASFYV